MSHDLNPTTEAVTDDVDHALGHSWFFDTQTIKVSVVAGTVTLSGEVRSQRERRMAAAAAWAHEDVIDVQNDLVVAES
jgi:osmotically-inducible protein OsmY